MQQNPGCQFIHVIDSHTAGEPTRVVVDGGPDLGGGSVSEQSHRLESLHDSFRRAVINEPRGSDVLVGALLCEPSDRNCAAGAIFFNNAGYLGMCGHGTIGVIVTLAYAGTIDLGKHRIETPVGVVAATFHGNGKVTVENVPSYRSRKDVVIHVPEIGNVRGDVAWGGNWFFLTEDHKFDLTQQNTDELTEYAWKVRQALKTANITGDNGAEIDHIEMFAPCRSREADSDNFVLCPGKAYDRSPCRTGTSAKLACLYADGRLRPGNIWRQRGILGTVFEGTIAVEKSAVIPSITGSAYITAESTLVFDPNDPFQAGISR